MPGNTKIVVSTLTRFTGVSPNVRAVSYWN